MAVSYALTLPAGYWTVSSRNEFNEPCLALHNERAGWVSDHDCRADAIYAAQEHADSLADEASAEDAAVAVGAYEATLDTIHAMISGLIAHPLPGDDEARGEQRAVRDVLRVLDSISVPVSEDRKAA